MREIVVNCLKSLFLCFVLFFPFSKMCSADVSEKATLNLPQTDFTTYEEPLDPKAHFLVVGDQFSLAMTRPGTQTETRRFSVLPEGKVVLPFLGTMSVSGMKLADFTQKAYKWYKQVFPKISIGLLLESPGEFSVSVLGEVVNPGQFNINAVTRLATLLKLAGGPTPWGSTRAVKIEGPNLNGSFDLRLFYDLGDKSQNPLIPPGSTLRVLVAKKRIKIVGEVNKPGTYELLEEEGVSELVEIAKGFTVAADPNSLLLTRYIRDTKGDSANQKIPVNYTGNEKIDLQNADTVTVFSYSQTKGGGVKVSGAVRNPGVVDVYEGMTLKDVLFQVGGLQPGVIKTEAILITHNTSGEELKINLDLKQYPNVKEILIKPGDFLFVFDPSTLREFTTVEGAVAIPGPQPYIPGMSLYDVLNMAGGLDMSLSGSANTEGGVTTKTINLQKSFILRRKFDNSGDMTFNETIPIQLDKLIETPGRKADDIKLEPGDRIVVAEVKDDVMVSGYVSNPGSVPYEPNMPAIHYARLAGIKEGANEAQIKTIRQTGAVLFGADQILSPGDILIVDEKPSPKRIRKLNSFTNIISGLIVFLNLLNK